MPAPNCCPKCGGKARVNQVYHSDWATVRYRECEDCGERFESVETVKSSTNTKNFNPPSCDSPERGLR